MPNHITNNITISGEKRKMELLKAILFQKDGKTINLEAILPPPENMFRGNIGQKEEADCKKKGIPTWYEWQTRNWGTKWNAYEGSYEVNSPTVISLQFDTAWAPPLGVFSALRDMGFQVNGSFIDEGDPDEVQVIS